MLRNLLVLIAVFCGISIVTLSLASRDRAANTLRPVIPDFAMTVDGKETTLYAQRNDIILVHFWATWCAPCLTEFPALVERVAKQKNVTLVAVSADREEKDMTEFLEKYKGKRITAAFDKDLVISNRFGVRQFPQTLILDRNFRVIHHVTGPADWENYRFPIK